MDANPNVPIKERAEQAKKNALKKQKDQQLRYAGFQKLGGGISFPGVNATQVNDAI